LISKNIPESSTVPPVLYPIPHQYLIHLFGEPNDLDEIFELEWLAGFSPLITSVKGIGLVGPILEKIGEEFCCCDSFDPYLISKLCYEGYLPMATMVCGRPVLLGKLHHQRCILYFDDLHIFKKVRKRAGNLEISVDRAFDKCIEYIKQQHDECWLYPPLVKAFKILHETMSENVGFHSIEVWEGTELVAGEIGYTVGSYYTSLSAFYRKNSAGSVQLCAAAKLLEKSGFSFWNLGMEMDYKFKLGAQSISKNVFLATHEVTRNQKCSLQYDRVGICELFE
jgi:arginyl-tRNA---protein transferase